MIHIASASATSAIEQRLVAIHAEPGRKSAMKPSRNVRIVTAADSHALAMDQSLSRLRRDQMPMLALKCHCNRRYKTHPYRHPCHCHRMALVTIIGVAYYHQLQLHRNLTIVSLLRYKAPPTSGILKAAITGEAPHGSIEIRIVRIPSAIPFHRSNTTSQCHPPHISNLDQ